MQTEDIQHDPTINLRADLKSDIPVGKRDAAVAPHRRGILELVLEAEEAMLAAPDAPQVVAVIQRLVDRLEAFADELDEGC